MTPDDTTPEIDDERAGLIDLLASLRTDGVEPDADLLRRAGALGVDDAEIGRRTATMADLRAGLVGLSDREATTIADDELSTRRSVQRALELGHPEPATRHAAARDRRGRHLPSSVVAVAAATVIVAGIGFGGWIVAQDSSEQLASDDAAESIDAATATVGSEESDGPVPPLPPGVPVIGTAATPDQAIDLAGQHWTTARTSADDADTGFRDDGVDQEPSAEGVPAPAAGSADELSDRCDFASDSSEVVVVVIDDQPHLVIREPGGDVVVLRLVDCREVARA